MDNINFLEISIRVLGSLVGCFIVGFFIFRKISKLEERQSGFEKSIRLDYFQCGKALGEVTKIANKNSADIERINNPVTIAIGEIHQRMNGIDDRINKIDKN